MDTHEVRNGEREVITSFATQAEAMEAVQLLADRKVDAECVTITRDALSVARPPTPARRVPLALVGALFGAALGAIFGIALGTSWPMFAGLLLGAVGGATMRPPSVPSDAGRAPTRIEIERHDVVTHRDHAAEARRVLDQGGFRVR
jgi:hypothetical protein